MQTILKIFWFYLQSLDALIRLIGTYLIIGLMFAALGVLLNSIHWLLYGTFTTGPMHLWVGLLLAPPILRLGILAGGFAIPPLFQGRSKRDEANPAA